MKLFAVVLIFIIAASAHAEHAGRGMVRHTNPGIQECREQIAEIVELPAKAAKPQAPAKVVTPVKVAAPAEPVFVAPVFVAAEDVPVTRIPEPLLSRVEILDEAAVDSWLILSHTKLTNETPVTQGPTPEQLQMMRELHLSAPPTILNADNSVRASGKNYKGAALSAPSVEYCPECQRKDNARKLQ